MLRTASAGQSSGRGRTWAAVHPTLKVTHSQAAVALMGLSLGALLRNSAGAIVTLVAALFVLPIIFQLIPNDFFKEARKYLPTNAANAMMEAGSDNPLNTAYLEPWQGTLVIAAYVVVLLFDAFTTLKQRDV